MHVLLWIVMLVWGSSIGCAAAFGIAARSSRKIRIFLFGRQPARLSNDLR